MMVRKITSQIVIELQKLDLPKPNAVLKISNTAYEKAHFSSDATSKTIYKSLGYEQPLLTQRSATYNKNTQSKVIESDINVKGLYLLLKNPKIEYIIVIFHAEWCVPCTVIKTPFYQKKIEQFNETN